MTSETSEMHWKYKEVKTTYEKETYQLASRLFNYIYFVKEKTLIIREHPVFS